jgi:hypothetical protein
MKYWHVKHADKEPNLCGAPASFPSDWHVQEHRWDVYHWLRTSALIMAFVSLLQRKFGWIFLGGLDLFREIWTSENLASPGIRPLGRSAMKESLCSGEQIADSFVWVALVTLILPIRIHHSFA